MQTELDATLIIPTRQELLKAWKDRDRLTRSFRRYGRIMGISGVSVGRLCSGETMPSVRYRQLVELGVPGYLLPRAEDLRPGRKPRRAPGLHEEFQAAAFRG